MTKQRGWFHTEVEFDALNVINALNSCAPVRSELEVVLEDIQDLISNISVIFKYAPRNANRVTYNIASYDWSSKCSKS